MTAPPLLPAPWPLGHLSELRADWFALLQRVALECGDAGQLRIAGRPLLVFNHPALAQQILIDQADAFDKGPTLRHLAGRFLGSGLITVRQADHARLRALVAPAFAPRHMSGYAALMQQACLAAAARLHHGDTLDLYDFLYDLTIDSIGRTLFSADLQTHQHALRSAVDEMLAWITRAVQQPWALPWLVPTAHNRRAKAALAQLQATFSALVAARRSQPAEHTDVLALLLAAQAQGLTDQELRDQLATLCIAGFETTASTLTWAFALLAAHPQWQDQLVAEIDAGSDPGPETATRRVIDETLRLYPAAHTLGRQALREVQIGPWQVRKGALLVVSPWLMHRREQAFADPERFDPDRWLRERHPPLPRCAFLPFGAGPRACLGGAFATLQMQTVLTTLLRDWRFVPVHPGLPRGLIQPTLRPESLVVRVESRRGATPCASC